jgi:hypothetical protein
MFLYLNFWKLLWLQSTEERNDLKILVDPDQPNQYCVSKVNAFQDPIESAKRDAWVETKVTPSNCKCAISQLHWLISAGQQSNLTEILRETQRIFKLVHAKCRDSIDSSSKASAAPK